MLISVFLHFPGIMLISNGVLPLVAAALPFRISLCLWWWSECRFQLVKIDPNMNRLVLWHLSLSWVKACFISFQNIYSFIYVFWHFDYIFLNFHLGEHWQRVTLPPNCAKPSIIGNNLNGTTLNYMDIMLYFSRIS